MTVSWKPPPVYLYGTSLQHVCLGELVYHFGAFEHERALKVENQQLQEQLTFIRLLRKSKHFLVHYKLSCHTKEAAFVSICNALVRLCRP